MDAFKIKKGLGRGLSSLIGDTKTKDNKNINKVPINEIERNQYQPRKIFNKENLQELTNSIKESGIIQPIIVRVKNNDKYEIIAGERRWLAAQNAGLNEVPVVVIKADNLKALEFAIVENVQRQDLNAIEEAQGYQRLIDEFSYDHERIAKFIGKSRSHVTNCIRLLNLPKEVIDYVENEKISAGHAKILVGLQNASFIANKIISKKLSVRQSESLVKALKNKKHIKAISNKDINIVNLEKELENKIGLNVLIKSNKNSSGTIIFEYKSNEQLDRLISIIKKNY